jgi:hypothetical protein
VRGRAAKVSGRPGGAEEEDVRGVDTWFVHTPAGWGVSWVRVPVRPSVSELRRAVFEALVLPGRFPHRSAEADERIVGALDEARVLVVDEAQRLPVPGGHGDPELAAGRSGPPRPVRGSGRPSICPWRLAPRCPACC